MAVRILTGWTNPGGSTTAFINLTNLFNKNGIDCILYGPHDWHLDKCQSGKLSDMSIKQNDHIIIHFFDPKWESRPPISGKFIYSCHEKNIRPVNSFNYKIFDKIHYVSRPQMEWHNVTYPYFILPNVLDDLNEGTKPKGKVAGIIGTIDENKQTHVSIQRALDDGFDKIILFGRITDHSYYTNYVRPFVDNIRVLTYGQIDDKQEMYDQVTDVYLSSLSETWSYIPKECEMTGTKFHGNDSIKGNFELNLTNEEILKEWKKELEI